MGEKWSFSKETKEKMSVIAKKYYKENPNSKRGFQIGVSYNKGKKLPWITVSNKKRKGSKWGHHTDETKKKISNTKLTKYTFEERSKIAKHARKFNILPKKDTTIEIKIQEFLNTLNINYFTHQYMNIKHGYQCDVFIPSLNLVIEADGNYWHDYPDGREIDHLRTKELLEAGYKVLRIWESDIRKMDIIKFQEMLI